jgi:hypothetical protein
MKILLKGEKMKKILILLILLVLSAQYSFSAELKSTIEAQYLNDEVIIKVKIYNPTEDSYIFALSDWSVKVNNGDFDSPLNINSFSFSSEIYFLVINAFIPGSFDAVFVHKFDKIPHFVHLFHKDSLDLTIHIKQEDFLVPLIKDTTYIVIIKMFYSECGTFRRSLRNIDCEFDEIVSNENHYRFDLKKTKKRPFHGVPHFKGCKWDKKYSEILDIGFVNWMEVVTQFNVPGD